MMRFSVAQSSRRQVASAVGNVQDITERKAAEDRLRESEERLRFIADDRERAHGAVRACLESGGQADYDIEYRTLWPDETVCWIRAKENHIRGWKPVRMAGFALEITKRKERDERERLLVREMNHRVKNILTSWTP
jgi:two-component sensor histidine kinase